MSKTFETDPPDADKELESRVSSVGDDGADAYKVGYRRPPKSSQFKKGQSGNPLGSSRKVRKRIGRQGLPLGDLVLENSQDLVPIREGNRRSEITMKEALIRRESALGIQGNRLALKAALDRIDKAEKNKLAEVLDYYTTYRDYKEQYPARAKACRDRGRPPPLPHPDDLHFNDDTCKLEITGPINYEQLDKLKKILEAREILISKLEGLREDADECAREGLPYSSKDREIFSVLENYIKFFDGLLEKRNWLPRIAGRKKT